MIGFFVLLSTGNTGVEKYHHTLATIKWNIKLWVYSCLCAMKVAQCLMVQNSEMMVVEFYCDAGEIQLIFFYDMGSRETMNNQKMSLPI